MLASTPHNRHRSARLDAQKGMSARQPFEMPGRYGFHSTRAAPWDAGRVVINVRASLSGLNPEFARAAASLGARPTRALRRSDAPLGNAEIFRRLKAILRSQTAQPELQVDW